VVRNLAVFNGILIILLVAYALARAMPMSGDHPFGVNGGAGFDSSGAAGHVHAGQRARRTRIGKPGRLANPALGVDEAASIDVLCADKTGRSRAINCP